MNLNPSAVCVLVSGGLDSAALVAVLSTTSKAVYPVYVRQGLAWETAELFWLRRFLSALRGRKNIRPLTVLALPMADIYKTHWSLGRKPVPGARTADRAVYLPGRNLLLTVKAAVFCVLNGIPRMALGSLDHNPFSDATPDFFRTWSRAIAQGLDKPLSIEAPFRALSKETVIRQNSDWPLHLSFSCLKPRGTRHCGRCNKCAERRRAFRAAGVEDRTVYAR
jgi:7-cyano-7-deazaguanine synthase